MSQKSLWSIIAILLVIAFLTKPSENQFSERVDKIFDSSLKKSFEKAMNNEHGLDLLGNLIAQSSNKRIFDKSIFHSSYSVTIGEKEKIRCFGAFKIISCSAV
jgi:hypothetical protein